MRAELRDYVLREGLDVLFGGHRWDVHEDEVSHAGSDVALDLVDALLLAADDHPLARLVRCGLTHHRDDLGDSILALFGRLVAHREHQGFFDFIGVAPDRIAMALDHSDQAFHLARINVGHVPHVGVFRDDFQQNFFAVPADHQRQMLLYRLGITDRVDDVVVLALERGLFLGEHSLDDLTRFVERLEAAANGFEIDAEAPMLQLEPSGAEA